MEDNFVKLNFLIFFILVKEEHILYCLLVSHSSMISFTTPYFCKAKNMIIKRNIIKCLYSFKKKNSHFKIFNNQIFNFQILYETFLLGQTLIVVEP